MAKIRNPLPMTVEWNRLNRRELYLDHLIKHNKWQTGAEVGVRFGRVLFYLLDHNPRLKMYAIDIDIDQFYTPKIQDKYKDRLVVLSGESWSQAEHIKETLDFVFIDASHSRKSVVKDIRAYAPKINTPQGLLGHDIDFPSVQQALYECNITVDVCPDNVWAQK